MQLLGCSLDLSKIDKSKIVEGKNGAKYYNFTVIVNDTPNQYGKDVSICQEQTKEQRMNKEQRFYIGSGKTLFKTESKSESSSHGMTTRDGITTKDDDDLLF